MRGKCFRTAAGVSQLWRVIMSTRSLVVAAALVIVALPLLATAEDRQPAGRSAEALFERQLPAAKPEEVGMSAERLHRVNDAIQRYIDGGQLAGAVSLVARKGRVVHYEAQGVMDLE